MAGEARHIPNVISAAARILVGAVGLLVVGGALIAGGPVALLTFTLQSNLMMAVSFLWTAWALLRGTRTPPEWLAGSAVYYIAITGAVYNFVLNPGSFRVGRYVLWGFTSSDIAHVITPVAAVVIWLVLAEHRRIPWRYIGMWLIYLFAYLVAIIIALQTIPAFTSPYPFLDPVLIGWGGVARWSLQLLVAFATLATIMIAVDRWLPARTRISEYDPHDQ